MAPASCAGSALGAASSSCSSLAALGKHSAPLSGTGKKLWPGAAHSAGGHWEGLRDRDQRVGGGLRKYRSPRAVLSPIPVPLVPHIMGPLGICCGVPGWMHRILPWEGWQSCHRDIRAACPDSGRGSSVPCQHCPQHQVMAVPSERQAESLWECPQSHAVPWQGEHRLLLSPRTDPVTQVGALGEAGPLLSTLPILTPAGAARCAGLCSSLGDALAETDPTLPQLVPRCSGHVERRPV